MSKWFTKDGYWDMGSDEANLKYQQAIRATEDCPTVELSPLEQKMLSEEDKAKLIGERMGNAIVDSVLNIMFVIVIVVIMYKIF